jgi:glucokinase
MYDAASETLGLVGDIGGTNARFALTPIGGDRARLISPASLPCRDYPTVEAALAAYFKMANVARWPSEAAIAVAGPVTNGAITFTNMGWSFSESGLSGEGRFGRAVLMNDYAAQAMALPDLGAADFETIGPDVAGDAAATLAVMGPGTGFGVSALVREHGREAILSGEGGHVAFAPADAEEMEVFKIMSARFGRISVERVLSGPGLLNLHHALCTLHGDKDPCTAPDQVTTAATAGDPVAVQTLRIFCGLLGTVAGDFALSYGARGGVFITGGIAPNIMEILRKSAFRERFEAKGRFESYNRAIPTRVVVHPYTALLGAAKALKRPEVHTS